MAGQVQARGFILKSDMPYAMVQKNPEFSCKLYLHFIKVNLFSTVTSWLWDTHYLQKYWNTKQVLQNGF